VPLTSALCSTSFPRAWLARIGSAAAPLTMDADLRARGLQESGNDFKLQSNVATGLNRPEATSPVQRNFDVVGRSGGKGWIALMSRKYKKSARGLAYLRLRVILADDQTIFRHGLRAILDAEPDLEVIGEASNMQDAVVLTRRLLPDVLITDIAFSNGIEVQALSQLRRECAGVRVLLLTAHSCQECMRAAMTTGVRGYILKHSPFEVLLRAIHSEDAEYEHSELPLRATGTQGRAAAQSAKARIAEMTARERQVLIGVAQGYSNKRIAGNLGRSVKTIEKHRFKMMHRLGLPNAAAATRYALDNGLLRADDGAQEPDPSHGPAEAGTSPAQIVHSQRRTRTPN
jgi:two-component system, NarL family, response regulator NreC